MICPIVVLLEDMWDFLPLFSNLILPVQAITFCDKRINTAGRINEVSMTKNKGDKDY